MLSLVGQGLVIPLKDLPPLCYPLFQPVASGAIQEEVTQLLQKGAIEPVAGQPLGFYSTMFLVPKPDGTNRPIINLRRLNAYVDCPSFKMDNIATVRSALVKDMWACRLDLKDAYFHIAIHPKSRHLLRFCVGRQCYQFKALPFGLSVAPYFFTQIVNAVAGVLRRQGVNMILYLDDWLVLNQSREKLLEQMDVILETLKMLGFVVNLQKSLLNPCQTFQFLGVVFNTVTMTSTLSQGNTEKVLEWITQIQSKQSISAQECLAILGLLNFAAPQIYLGRLHMRPVQMWLLARWKPVSGCLSDVLVIDHTLKQLLGWWNATRMTTGVSLVKRDTSLIIQSDASNGGWGAVLGNQQAHGVWDCSEKKFHINCLEAMALFKGLKQFEKTVQGHTVLCQLDNSTAVQYIKRQGGTKSPTLCKIVWDLLHWCQARDIQLVVRHIPGKMNILADQLSRQLVHTEWSLNPHIVHQIFKRLGTPMIDLFATRFNKKLPLYVSPVPDQEAVWVDSLSRSWNGLTAYAFPPAPILPLVLQKVAKESCTVILIAPFWPKRSWFSLLIHLLVDRPLALPPTKNMLTQGHKSHPSPEIFHYHAWMLSSNKGLIEDFLKKQPCMQHNAYESLPSLYTQADGEYSVIGVNRGRLILSEQLPLN